MPNYVSNTLTASSQVINYLMVDGKVDFNTVVPTPEIISDKDCVMHVEKWAEIAVGNVNPWAKHTGDPLTDMSNANVYNLFQIGPYPKDFSDEDFEEYIKYIRALRATGHANWYTWNIANWGVKWNAGHTKRKSDNEVTFETAWSVPRPVIVALSEKFPEEKIQIQWADEDFGCNVGDITFLNGEVIHNEKFIDSSNKAKEHALKVIYEGELPSHLIRNENGEIIFTEE